jgi:hypothetical protein
VCWLCSRCAENRSSWSWSMNPSSRWFCHTYRTCGDTCCPSVSTPKTRSLADSCITNHISWRNPTISTIPTLLKPQHRSSPRSPHIMTDGRPTLSILIQAKLNIIKMERLVRHSWLQAFNRTLVKVLHCSLIGWERRTTASQNYLSITGELAWR